MDNEDKYSEILNKFANDMLYKIVVIDDDPDIVKLVIRFVKEEYSNVECIDAPDGLRGLGIIEKKIPDLIILDINMPGFSGLDTLEEIRKHKNKNVSGIPVIMLTAKRDVETVSEAIKIGATNYIAKPFQKSELITRIKSLIG